MRVIGLDLGSKRVGVAVSDSSGTIAGPLTVLQRSGLRADHRRTLTNTPQRLTKIAAAANERHVKWMLVDMIFVIGRSKYF